METITPIKAVQEHANKLLTPPDNASISVEELRYIIGGLADLYSMTSARPSTDHDNPDHKAAVMQTLGMFHEPGFWAHRYSAAPSTRLALEYTEKLVKLLDLDQGSVPLTCPKKGRIVRRIATALFKTFGWKIDDEIKQLISHKIQLETYEYLPTFDFTKDFKWDAGDYGDHGSCFWTCHRAARFTMEIERGYYAMRSYDKSRRGNGRCWMYVNDKAFVLFNAYGPVLRRFAITLQSWYNAMTDDPVLAKEVAAINEGEWSGDLYINHGSAHLVSSDTETLSKYSASHPYDFDLYVDHSLAGESCALCGDYIDDGYTYEGISGDTLCEYCFNDTHFYCERCSETEHVDNSVFVYRLYNGRRYETSYCQWCYENYTAVCELDEELWDIDAMIELTSGGYVSRLHEDELCTCEECDGTFTESEVTVLDIEGALHWFCDEHIDEAKAELQSNEETINE